jgi:hypothetical protein
MGLASKMIDVAKYPLTIGLFDAIRMVMIAHTSRT